MLGHSVRELRWRRYEAIIDYTGMVFDGECRGQTHGNQEKNKSTEKKINRPSWANAWISKGTAVLDIPSGILLENFVGDATEPSLAPLERYFIVIPNVKHREIKRKKNRPIGVNR
jgi:hypothetical protein